jgi:hypothetical protein
MIERPGDERSSQASVQVRFIPVEIGTQMNSSRVCHVAGNPSSYDSKIFN